jgi:hypothetical protein
METALQLLGIAFDGVKFVLHTLWVGLLMLLIALGVLLIAIIVIGFLIELPAMLRNALRPLLFPADRTFDHAKTFPIYGRQERISWSVATYAYERQQQKVIHLKPLREIEQNGGLTIETLDEFYPYWRTESDLITDQRAQIEALQQHVTALERSARLENKGIYKRTQAMHRRAQKAESRVAQLEKELLRVKVAPAQPSQLQAQEQGESDDEQR